MNQVNRTSISFDIVECDSRVDLNCESRDRIRELLKHLKFKQYQLVESTDFLDTDMLFNRPIKTKMDLTN